MDNMLQKLEDKVVALVDELETTRTKMHELIKETQELKYENQELKAKVVGNNDKLQGIMSLLDSIEDKPAAPVEATASEIAREEVSV